MTHHRHGKPDVLDVIRERTPHETKVFFNDASGKTVGVTQPIQFRTKVVAWGFPLDELMFSKWFINFLCLPVMPWDIMLTAQSTYLPDARNIIHENFVKGCSAEYLVMVDSDVLVPPNFLTRLLSYHLPMVGGWYRKKGGNHEPVVYDYEGMGEDGKMKWHPRTEPGKGLEKVDGAGAGCWLMRRDVAEAIGERPYDMLRGGEDLDLCLKVRDAGFDLYVDWDVACAHAGVMYV